MERPLTTFIFLISGFAFSILSLIVESRGHNGANSSLSPPPPSPSPPPPPPPPSPPPPSPSPPPFSPPPPPPRRHRRTPPPPRAFPAEKTNSPPVFWNNHNNHNTNQGSKRSLNEGKKVGLFFVCIAGVLQIGVVGFLVFKRWQLLICKGRYEGFS